MVYDADGKALGLSFAHVPSPQLEPGHEARSFKRVQKDT